MKMFFVYVVKKEANHRRIKMAERFVEGNDESIGKGEFANMPKDVYMKEYPKGRRPADGMIDDSMVDVDDIEEQAMNRRRRYWSKQK